MNGTLVYERTLHDHVASAMKSRVMLMALALRGVDQR